ncbi:MAG: flavin reductase family protein [Candidatus Aminicenantes bacterium]|nr:flavin reductase family protein [Candidatus Aminicenantes bacterium]
MKTVSFFIIRFLIVGNLLALFGNSFLADLAAFPMASAINCSAFESPNQKIKTKPKKSLGARPALPSPVWVIGSYDKDGRPNAMTSAWAGICCSRPPCVTISLRKETYTYGNILEKKAFTVNIPSESQAAYAAYFGSVSGKQIDKFSATGLTPVKSHLVDAPYIAEFPLVLECKLIQTLELGSHTMFIGEIIDMKADETILTPEGGLDVEKLKGFFFLPGRGKFYRYGDFLGDIAPLAEKIKTKK